ncbi:MAG TPA: helix-turn-helix domain-containing protein [Bacteroidota bacterium]|nr:helix-turn-helix domain-containing protein [Bacteroidota bacterium]
MKAFFQELKRTREEKKMTLADIADRTLINVRYLEALERGDTSILPEAYVRAFIREYAQAIGLDGAQTLRRFDQARRPQAEAATPTDKPRLEPGIAGAAPARSAAEPPAKTPAPAPPRQVGYSLGPSTFLTPRMATIAAGAVIVAVAGVLAWNLFSSGSPSPVTEIPFQNVVREAETQTAAAHPPPPPPVRHIDSLTLAAAVTDTVWMTITVDSLPPHEYIFHPGGRATWHAAERFVLTLGNAGAVQFTLNQKSLGTLGRRGSVMRNVPLTRQTLAGRQ